MNDFRILRTLETGALRFADQVVDTHVLDDVAHVAVSDTKGVTNPLHLATFGELGGGIFKPTLWERTTNDVIRGTGSSAFDDAVQSLHNLGRRYGVNGIHVGDNPNYAGLIKFSDDIGYAGGSPVTERIGHDAAMRIDAAARRVLEFVDAPR
jgi:hypothetical protein